MSDESMIHKAIEFATLAHKGQTRKGTDTPYIVHPFEVALILTQAGCSKEIVVAGLLYDTVEDANVSLEQIENEFGSVVSKLVDSCSEDKSKSWEERKQHTIDYLSGCDDGDILILNCADKTANLRSIKADLDKYGDKVWERFNKGKKEICWYYSKLNDAFESLHKYNLYWENTNLFQDIFVTYYIDENEELMIQGCNDEYYGNAKCVATWIPEEDGKLRKIIELGKVRKITKELANEYETKWNINLEYGENPAQTLMQNRNNKKAIRKYAEYLYKYRNISSENYDDLYDNMGGGLGIDLIKSIQLSIDEIEQTH